MKTFAELVEFSRNLFFDGAVQINWFENDHTRRDKAASNFVFHGPEYHGVSPGDINETQGYRLTDTASFCKNIIQNLGSRTDKDNPISLAIAGYGTGKSHLGLTLSTLLSDPKGGVANSILSNIKNADYAIGTELSIQLKEYESPILVIPINGMGNFDLAAELSRQTLIQLKSHDLDTTPIDELWPRFQQAFLFVERNYDLREDEFNKRFGNESLKENILDKLTTHDDLAFQLVNEIFEQANGYPIRAVGQESPQQLIQTLCSSYCGQGKPFQSMLILFDEFGRYLEFAAERPHIAGDAALQQIFEGVQDNGDKCNLLCLNQYELKVYLSRISRDRQSTIQRYITRYDSAKKYYLSSNLETLFAHLIKKKDAQFISAYLSDTRNAQKLDDLQRWFPSSRQQGVWKDRDLYGQVIVQGCWPLHPLATLFLSRSSDFLQQRSAITFVADAFDQVGDRTLSLEEAPWTISATDICDSPLIKELIASEEYGQGGAVAQAYDTVTQKYHHDFSRAHRHVLLAVLIASKLGLKVTSKQEAHTAFCSLSGLGLRQLEQNIGELLDEYGVLEWNDRFFRYEIIGDAVPRSVFFSFLKQKIKGITEDHIENLFASHGKAWAGLNDLDPQFAVDHHITTPEWVFHSECSDLGRLSQSLKNAINDWRTALKPDQLKGQVIYCYVRGDEILDIVTNQVKRILNESVERAKCPEMVPVFIVLLHDIENRISKSLAEYSALSGPISTEDEQKFSHFINDHKNKSLEELKQACEDLKKQRQFIVTNGLTIENARLNKVGYSIFKQIYPNVLQFPFDGFGTAKGQAVKDCRLITTELLKGTLNHEWIVTQESKVQNRTKHLLSIWDSMGDNGEIMLHPRHQGLRQIIINLELKLERDKLLNIGTLIGDLIAPPYGFNIASAGLVLGIFLSSRKNTTVLLLDDQEISPGQWIGSAFVGFFLNFTILDKSSIRYMSETETGEWQKLLSHWDFEQSYVAKVAFMSSAKQLRDRVPLPSGELHERFLRLEEQTEKAIKVLRWLDNFLEKEEMHYEISFKKHDAGNMSRIACDLLKQVHSMEKDSHLWTDEQCDRVRQQLTSAKQSVVHFFDEWLSLQSCLSSKQIGDFRRKMIDQICKNLKLIGLRDKADKLEQHTIKIISGIEEREIIKFIIENSQAFLKSHRVHPECRVAELRQWVRGAEELIPPLIKAGKQVNAPEVKKTLERIDIFISECKDCTKQHENRVQDLWDFSFLKKEDVYIAQREVSLMLSIFSGDKPANTEDLVIMQKQLLSFDENLSLWSDLNMSNSELKLSVTKRINYEVDKRDDVDELVWDIEETYNNILDSLLVEREALASKWISQLPFSHDDIKNMNARKCQATIGRLESTPIFLGAKQNLIVDKLQEHVKERLNNLKLEGVLEMFENLDSSLKKQFLEIVTMEGE